MKSSRRHHYYNPYQLIGGEVPSSAYYPVLRPNYYWVQPQLGSYYQQQMPYLMPGKVMIMVCHTNTRSARNGNLEVMVYVLKAKQGYAARKNKDKWAYINMCRYEIQEQKFPVWDSDPSRALNIC
jgi:hypothetical protein